PNARNVEVVIGKTWHKSDWQAKTPLNPPGQPRRLPFDEIRGGYIADDDGGALEGHARTPMTRQPDGVWVSLPDPSLPFHDYDHRPYMYRVTKDNGTVVFRTDIHSRCQIGGGAYDPQGAHFDGQAMILEGSRS